MSSRLAHGLLTQMTESERPRVAAVGGALVLSGPIARADVARLCERARPQLERCEDDPIECDVGGLAGPDAVTVEALARLQLTALRLGRRLRFRDACGELRHLVAFVGLERCLPCDEGGSALEPRRQAEHREQALGVEEEAQPDDLVP